MEVPVASESAHSIFGRRERSNLPVNKQPHFSKHLLLTNRCVLYRPTGTFLGAQILSAHCLTLRHLDGHVLPRFHRLKMGNLDSIVSRRAILGDIDSDPLLDRKSRDLFEYVDHSIWVISHFIPSSVSSLCGTFYVWSQLRRLWYV